MAALGPIIYVSLPRYESDQVDRRGFWPCRCTLASDSEKISSSGPRKLFVTSSCGSLAVCSHDFHCGRGAEATVVQARWYKMCWAILVRTRIAAGSRTAERDGNLPPSLRWMLNNIHGYLSHSHPFLRSCGGAGSFSTRHALKRTGGAVPL